MFELCLLTTMLFSQYGAGPAACAVIEPDDARLRCYDGYFRGEMAQRQEATDTEVNETEADPPQATIVTGAPATVAGAVEGAVQAAPSAARAAPSASRPQRELEDEFGLTQAQLDERTPSRALDSIEARVASVQSTATGRVLLKLENDQSWVTVEPSRHRLFRPGDTVTIRRAALGSFMASGPHSGTGVRVRRVE